jgi:replicative DNA helicase
MSAFDQLPPASPDHERRVISAMMQDPANCVPAVVEAVSLDAFRHPSHRTIVEAIVTRFQNRQGCDLISITQELTDQGKIDEIGGVGTLAEIFTAAVTVTNLKEDLDEVRRKAILMALWKTAHSTMEAATKAADEGNPDLMLDDIEQAFYGLRQTFQRQDELLKPASAFINQAIDQFESAYKARGTGVLGVPTGFVDLDRMLNGLKGGQLVILAARPSVGKSAFAMNILMNAANAGHGVALFSLEMSGMEMSQRMICSEADVSLQRVRDGFLAKTDFPRISMASSRLNEKNLWIDETPALSLYALRARARRLKMQHKIGMIVIDYLQLMRCPSKRGEANRALEIADITGGLKQLAKELDIPIIALAQLNREAERRGEPKLSDLRESGSIEQDADIVLLMHRNKEDPDEPTRLFVAKQRNGPVGPIELLFDGEKTRFRDCTDRKYSNSDDHRQKNYKKAA